MCLAIPMQVKQIDHSIGIADLEGNQHTVDLSLLESVKVGDFVIVHAGFAIQLLDRQEADERLALFEEFAEVKRQASA